MGTCVVFESLAIEVNGYSGGGLLTHVRCPEGGPDCPWQMRQVCEPPWLAADTLTTAPLCELKKLASSDTGRSARNLRESYNVHDFDSYVHLPVGSVLRSCWNLLQRQWDDQRVTGRIDHWRQ